MASLLTQIKVRKDTYENIKDLVLTQGEPGFAHDTGDYAVGNGTNKFSDICFKLQKGVINNGTSTDNAIARFDGTTGRVVQNSEVLIQDNGSLKTVENKMGLQVRTHASYEGGWVYGTAGNEALTLALQNPVTAFQIVYGTKPSAFGTNTWQTVTPLFQTKDGKVIINRQIDATADTTNLKLLDVNGTLGVSGQITSTVAAGTAPFAVTSTTINTNLNADLLDGKHASEFQPAGDYLTEESDTLQTVTNRGATTNKAITTAGLTTTSGYVNITGISGFSEGIRLHPVGGISSIWWNATANSEYCTNGMWGITAYDYNYTDATKKNTFRFRGPTSATATSPTDQMWINSSGLVTARGGFEHGGLTAPSGKTKNDYVLLAGGGTKALSDFTDTTYGADRGISLVDGKFGHSNTAVTAVTTAGLYKIKYDAYGHITGTESFSLPTVNNGKLTMAVSGTGLSLGSTKTFTANQSSNATITYTLDSNAEGNRTANQVVIAKADGRINSEQLSITNSGTEKVTMQYDTSYRALKFIFA